MEKRELIEAVLDRYANEGRYRPFTAGEVGRSAKVSTNCAKKWLRKMSPEQGGFIGEKQEQLRNGLIASKFYFDWSA